MTASSDSLIEFDAATYPRSMARHLPSVIQFPSVLWGNRWLLINFFRRELLSRFHGSMLGAFWVLIRPLFQFAVYFVIFGLLFGRANMGQEHPAIGFALYLFSGILLFTSMNEALSKCVNLVSSNANLVKKVAFPSQVLPVPICMVAVVIYFVGICLCLAVGYATGVIAPTVNLVLLPVLLVVWFVFILGFGMLLATLQVFVRDVQQLWSLVTMAWFFLSPVFWTPDFLCQRMEDNGLPIWPAEAWYFINPAFSLLTSSRMVLAGDALSRDGSGGEPLFEMTLSGQLGIATMWAVVYFVVGYSLFMSRRMKFADEV